MFYRAQSHMLRIRNNQPLLLTFLSTSQADHSEKPSILNLISKLVKTVISGYEYFALSYQVLHMHDYTVLTPLYVFAFMLCAGVQVPDMCRQKASVVSPGSVVTTEEGERCLEILSGQAAVSVR